jgi:hypothetical protein
MLSTRLLGFFLSTSGFSDWPGQEQEALSTIYSILEGYTDVWDMF